VFWEPVTGSSGVFRPVSRAWLLCAAVVGVQLAQVVSGGGQEPFAAAGLKAAAGQRGHLHAGLDLSEHWLDGLGAELVAGAAPVMAQPPE